MPTETWASASQNYYCKAIMKVAGGEYYYNWYAAKANPYECVDPTTDADAIEANDNLALGSICPKGWRLSDVAADVLWDSGNNPGALSTTGFFRSISQEQVGSSGLWWYGTRVYRGSGRRLKFDGISANLNTNMKYQGFSVRCMRSS